MNVLEGFIASRKDSWIDIRRDFHRNPELGFCEFRTAAVISDRLRKLGFELRLGKEAADLDEIVGYPTAAERNASLQRAQDELGDTADIRAFAQGIPAIVAEIKRGRARPVMAFRFDIDALPIVEADSGDHKPQKRGFRSVNEGVMHACGHDGHATIGLALAEWLASDLSDWSGTARLIFQPAEEGGRGALPMMTKGVVDNANYFLACHLGNKMPTGLVAAAATDIFYSSKFQFHFEGRAAHAAGDPQSGRNAILAAAIATLNLHGISRHSDGITRVNVGRIEGGKSHNVIAADCMIEAEVRALSESAWIYMRERANTIVHAAAEMHDVNIKTTHLGDAIGADSDQSLANTVQDVAGRVTAVNKIVPAHPNGGGEDATYFMKRVQERGGQACYFLVGATLPSAHHTPEFDFDEDGMMIAIEIFCRMVGALSGAQDSTDPEP